tara:strand:- start:1240 stop:2691 length:1452 start_codon:yes stop_codon:yes gene_type:complete
LKVLLTIPRSNAIPGIATYPHVGIAYLAGALNLRSIEVRIFDMRLDTESDLIDIIRSFQPDLVGVTAFSQGYQYAYEIIEITKSLGNYPVVIGGPHVSAILGKVLDDTKADFAVKQEGEETCLELLNAIKKGKESFRDINGLIWRNGKKIVENPNRPPLLNLDDLPFPAYDSFELERYVWWDLKRLPILTSRGCPYSCIYCSIKLSLGSQFRARSPDNVVEEIEYWYKKGWTTFSINDDCFNLDMNRAKKICDLILERKLKINFSLYNGIRADRVDEDLLYKMKQSGCVMVQYGLESGNDQVLKMIKKGITVKKVVDAVNLTNKVGLNNVVNFIIGHPSETYEKAMDSLRLAQDIPSSYVCVYNLVPYPGTDLFEWIKNNGTFNYPLEEYLKNVSYGEKTPIFETKDFSTKERQKILEKGFLLHRKKLLQFRFGRIKGFLMYLLIGKSDFLWNSALQIYESYIPSITNMVKKKLYRKLCNIVA